MKNWEDIVKEKLEGYESPLPEGSLAEFRARRDAAGSQSSAKRSPFIWIVPSAVAAGLVAFFFLSQPGTPDDGMRNIQEPVSSFAVTIDSTEKTEPMPLQHLVAQAVTPKPLSQASAHQQETATESDAAQVTETETTAGQTEQAEQTGQAEQTEKNPDTGQSSGSSSVMTPVPYIPDVTTSTPIGINITPAAAAVAGGGVLAAILTPVFNTDAAVEPEGVSNIREAHSQYEDPVIGQTPVPAEPEPVPQKDEYNVTGQKHSIPLKLGLSTRIPLSERLFVTTGLEYSRYSSEINLNYSDAMRQNAHYLGIPVRLDWTLAANKRFDVYIGAGLAGDYCLGASLNWDKISRKDGLSFSLLGAGGVQVNINDHIGLYVEPELSWTAPSKNRVLATYRSDNPLMFSLAAGLRFSL